MIERAGQVAYELYCEALAHAEVKRRGSVVSQRPAWAFLSAAEQEAWCALGAEIPVRRLAERTGQAEDDRPAADASDQMRTGAGNAP